MEKMRQWTVLTALGVVGVLAAGWFLMVSPQRSHASQLRTDAASVEQSTSGLRSQIAQLKEQQKGETAQQKRLMEIATQIPDNPQLPALIRELSDAAHKAGVSLDSMAPGAPAAATTTAPATTGTAPALEQIPVTIAVTGSYFNIESFMRALEHLDRALKTTGLTLALNNGDTTAAGPAGAVPNALSGQIQAVVYESPSVAPAAATAQTAAPAQPSATQSTAPAQPATGSTTTPAQSSASEK